MSCIGTLSKLHEYFGSLIDAYTVRATSEDKEENELVFLMKDYTMGSASPNAGKGMECDAITAVVLGGTSLSGGRANMIGALIGAVLVQFVKMGLNMINASEAMKVIVTGAVLLLALTIDGIKHMTQKEAK